jgi:hypothetical protein
MELEKGKVATMTTVHLLQQARHELVPMRKATMDAFLLTAFILIWLLVFTGILFTYPWLVLPIYALAYLLAVVLRLRQATHDTRAAYDREQPSGMGQMLYAGIAQPLQQAAYDREPSLEGALQELTSTKTLIGAGLYWGNHPY